MWKGLGWGLVLLGLWGMQRSAVFDDRSRGSKPSVEHGIDDEYTEFDAPAPFWRLVKPVRSYIAASASPAIAASVPHPKAGPMSRFLAPVRYDIVGRAGAQLMVDIDGDGRDELVVATAVFPQGQGLATGVAHLFKAQENGQLFLWKTQALPDAPDYAWGGITKGDFNWDGRTDIAIGLFSGIALLASNGDGTFNVHHAQVGRSMHQLGVVDVDLDGNLDVVGLSWGYIMGHDPVRDGPSTAATIFFGSGSGTVSRTEALATPQRGYNDLKIADANGDGFLDLLITSSQAFHFWVVPHDRRGSFRTAIAYPNPSSTTNGSIAAGDFDRDGRTDLVVAVPSNSPDAALWLYRQGADGSLGIPTRYASLDSPGPMLAADFNNDHLIDIGVLHEGWNDFGVFLQDDRGLNPTEHLFPVVPPLSYNADHYNRSGMSVGRLNGDACPDVAMSDFNYGLIVLSSFQCPPSQPRVSAGPLPPRLR